MSKPLETNQIDVVATLREAARVINTAMDILAPPTGMNNTQLTRLVRRLNEVANVYETARQLPLFEAALSLEEHMGVDIDTFMDRQENGVGDYFNWHKPLAERGIRLIEAAKTHSVESVARTTQPG